MDQRCWRQAHGKGALETLRTPAVIADRNHKTGSGKARQLFRSANHRTFTEENAGSGRVIVEEDNLFERSGAASDVQHDLSVTPGSPNQ